MNISLQASASNLLGASLQQRIKCKPSSSVSPLTPARWKLSLIGSTSARVRRSSLLARGRGSRNAWHVLVQASSNGARLSESVPAATLPSREARQRLHSVEQAPGSESGAGIARNNGAVASGATLFGSALGKIEEESTDTAVEGAAVNGAAHADHAATWSEPPIHEQPHAREDSRELIRKVGRLPAVTPKPSPKKAYEEAIDRQNGLLSVAGDYLVPDGGPPRWFSPVDCAPPRVDVPLMLFIPGIDGTGLGALLQERRLSNLVELWCLHIPAQDRTSFAGLVDFVETTLWTEHERAPNRMLYLLAESFGGLVALAVSARNPTIPLRLVLANPATAFSRSELQPLIPLLRVLPDEVYKLVPFALSTTMGDPIRMAAAMVDRTLLAPEWTLAVLNRLNAMLPTLPVIADIMPRATLNWKLELLKEGCTYVEDRLQDVHAPVLVLASGQDRMLPSDDEADRLKKLLPDCTVRRFKDSGHTLLLEEDVDVAQVMKRAGFYQRASVPEDPVTAFMPPTQAEVEQARSGVVQFLRRLVSPVFFSTTDDGRVVRGLDALPDPNPPLLFIGYHQLFGFDLALIVDEVLEKRNILLRGLAHPGVMGNLGNDTSGLGDFFRAFGAVPVTGANLYKLLANGDSAMLFPGGVREAYHGKDEAYKLFWPDRPEFVRTAVRHGATIIPFAAVGADEGVNIVLGPEEVLALPGIGDRARQFAEQMPDARADRKDVFVAPLAIPRFPGPARYYFRFMKPVPTKGLADQGFLKDRVAAEEMYARVKREVEVGLEYLQHKRKDDPYESFPQRTLYELTWNGKQAPTFRP